MEERDGRSYYRRGPRVPRVCQFCADKIEDIDYKRTDILGRLISEGGSAHCHVSLGILATVRPVHGENPEPMPKP